jgi:hypothetical protein
MDIYTRYKHAIRDAKDLDELGDVIAEICELGEAFKGSTQIEMIRNLAKIQYLLAYAHRRLFGLTE